jgi:hypothetical protein
METTLASTTSSTARGEPSAYRAILWGGLSCGILDIAAAFVTWGLRGVSPIRVLQAIAAGLLGRGSFEGGLATAMLGLLCHFVIAFGAATVYYAASRKLRFMVDRAVVAGALYGIAVWLFMQFVVIPLSAIDMPRLTAGGVAIGLVIHMLFVGLPIALAVRRYSK